MDGTLWGLVSTTGNKPQPQVGSRSREDGVAFSEAKMHATLQSGLWTGEWVTIADGECCYVCDLVEPPPNPSGRTSNSGGSQVTFLKESLQSDHESFLGPPKLLYSSRTPPSVLLQDTGRVAVYSSSLALCSRRDRVKLLEELGLTLGH